MKLTQRQVDWVRQRQREVRDILAHDPKKGWGSLAIEQHLLSMLSALHNLELPAIADQSPKGRDPQGLDAKHASGGAEGNRPSSPGGQIK